MDEYLTAVSLFWTASHSAKLSPPEHVVIHGDLGRFESP